MYTFIWGILILYIINKSDGTNLDLPTLLGFNSIRNPCTLFFFFFNRSLQCVIILIMNHLINLNIN